MPTNQDTTKDGAAKRAALSLLKRGLATKSEMARCAGVSRQLVQHWAADLDINRVRNKAVFKLWRAELKKHR